MQRTFLRAIASITLLAALALFHQQSQAQSSENAPDSQQMSVYLPLVAAAGASNPEPQPASTGFFALTVDVLKPDGTALLSNVASGVSLADIDPLQYPSLRLRASLSSAAGGATPALDGWQVTWQAKYERRIYLPVALS